MYQFSGKIKTFSLTLITIGFLATGWSFYNGLNKTSADAKAALAAEQHGDHGNTAKNHDNSSAKQETHHNDTNEGRENHSQTTSNAQQTMGCVVCILIIFPRNNLIGTSILRGTKSSTVWMVYRLV